jgi:late competence protein required for DNA uptake (superfamily II DNA/RNA helicase)
LPPPDPPPSPEMRKEPDQLMGVPEEMRIRMEIERREQDYKKVMESVEKLNDMSTDLSTRFHQQGSLSPDDMKKLSTVEKLARQVLSHAGGEEVEDKDRHPASLAEAFEEMSAAAACIKKDMSAETRFVVSASVIAKSNEVISLSRFIRRAHKN